MMARATPIEVFAVLPKATELCDEDILPLITTASCMVDTIAADCASNLSEECLKQVEIYLTAHLAAQKEFTLNVSSETDACSNSQATYGWKLGEGIKGSPFGQTADMLSNGCLSKLTGNASANASSLISFNSIGCR